MSSLPELITQRMQAQGLNEAATTKALGITRQQFNKVLSGDSFPNKRSIEAYAGFLGISSAELAALKHGGGTRSVRAPRAKAPEASEAGVAPFASLVLFGRTFDFADAAALWRFLQQDGGEVKLQVMGQQLSFANLDGVRAWGEQFRQLFQQAR